MHVALLQDSQRDEKLSPRHKCTCTRPVLIYLLIIFSMSTAILIHFCTQKAAKTENGVSRADLRNACSGFPDN